MVNTPHPSLLLWLISMIKQTLVLQRLWLQFTGTRDIHLWQIVSDADCCLFCRHMVSYFDAIVTPEVQNYSEPESTWWWVWKSMVWSFMLCINGYPDPSSNG